MSYTIEQAREVMRETQAILDAPGYGADPRRARASAQTEPPAEKYTFADEIVRHQEDGATLAQATQLAANARPDLREAWVEEENAKMQNAEQEKSDAAARFRSRNM